MNQKYNDKFRGVYFLTIREKTLNESNLLLVVVLDLNLTLLSPNGDQHQYSPNNIDTLLKD